MVALKLLLLTLTLYNLIVNLDARSCPKGQRVIRDRAGCHICPDGYYQPQENHSQHCKVCTRCNEDSGSFVKEECTKETDTKCQCRGAFVPRDNDSSTCKCDIGFGLKRGQCSKCDNGYFSTNINLPCQKWKECKSGVNVTGTKHSDVICNELNTNTYVTTPPTSNKVLSLLTNLPSHRPHEGALTQKMPTTTTRSAPGHAVTPSDKVHTGNHAGMVLLVFGIVGLFVLTAVTCKLNMTPSGKRKPAVQTQDSLCRRPVEESGDDSLSSLKLNPEGP